MADIVNEVVDDVVETVENLGKDAEEVFPPKPGGIVDRFRKKMAEEEARAQEEANEAEKITQRAVKAVKTAPESPEVFSAQTVSIAPGATSLAPVLPGNDYRVRAVVKVVTTGGSVVLAKDQSSAFSGVGYVLSASDGPLEIRTRGQVWAYNNGSSTVQVSVLSEYYASR